MKSPVAIFTIVQNEDKFLRTWANYYATQFPRDTVYILDHNSTFFPKDVLDSHTTRVPVRNSYSFDHVWLRDTVQDFQQFLLKSYEWVIFAEVDEILVADPAIWGEGGLREKILASDRDALRAKGFALMQERTDNPIVWWKRLLPQREWMFTDHAYDKALISRVPLEWSVGFHDAKYKGWAKKVLLHNERVQPPDNDLYLLHLHKIDYRMCMERHEESAKRNWREPYVEPSDNEFVSVTRNAVGNQNRLTGEALEDWYYTFNEHDRVKIPESFKGVL